MENATARGDDVLEISKSREAQMIRHMRHGSPPRLMALQLILSPNRRESLPAPSAGDRMTHQAVIRNFLALPLTMFLIRSRCGPSCSRGAHSRGVWTWSSTADEQHRSAKACAVRQR